VEISRKVFKQSKFSTLVVFSLVAQGIRLSLIVLLLVMFHSPTTRHTLIARLKDRQDALAWEEFVELYSPVIARIAKQRGTREHDVQEVLQDVLLAIVKAISNYDPRQQQGSFRRWLMTIAKNKALNRLTRKPLDEILRAPTTGVEECVTPCPASNSEAELEKEWQHQVFVLAAEEVRKRVQPQTWTAFWRTAVEGCDPELVANELGMELGTVYVARSRTLAKIRSWVANQSNRWETKS